MLLSDAPPPAQEWLRQRRVGTNAMARSNHLLCWQALSAPRRCGKSRQPLPKSGEGYVQRSRAAFAARDDAAH